MPPPYFDREDREYIPKNVSSGWIDYDRSFPTQDMADRFDYGYAQMWNPQRGARDVGPWLEEDDYYGPNAFEGQLGLASFPGAAKKYAELSNEGFYQPHFDSPAQLRNLLGYANAINADQSLINPMYADLYNEFDDPNPPNFTPDMYTSKREQVEDEENTFVANLMENYGRDNPLLQELGGMETTEVTSPRGDVTTTEEYIDDGYNLRDLYEIRSGYGSNLDSNNWPYGVRPPSQRPGGMDWRNPLPPSNIGYDRAGPRGVPSNIGYDRAGPRGPAYPPLDIGYDRAGPVIGRPPSNIGYDRAGPISSGPPSNIGFARAGSEPALPPSDIGYDRAGRAPRWWEIW